MNASSILLGIGIGALVALKVPDIAIFVGVGCMIGGCAILLSEYEPDVDDDEAT